jgi:flagellar hook-basal body complex protein FliE
MSVFNVTAVHRARIAALGMTDPRGGTGGVGSAGWGFGAGRAAGAGAPSVDFGDALARALGEVSAAQENAQQSTAAFLRGEPIEMHQVMAAGEEAGIALEMLVEIRNKLVETYRTLTSMQA